MGWRGAREEKAGGCEGLGRSGYFGGGDGGGDGVCGNGWADDGR